MCLKQCLLEEIDKAPLFDKTNVIHAGNTHYTYEITKYFLTIFFYLSEKNHHEEKKRKAVVCLTLCIISLQLHYDIRNKVLLFALPEICICGYKSSSQETYLTKIATWNARISTCHERGDHLLLECTQLPLSAFLDWSMKIQSSRMVNSRTHTGYVEQQERQNISLFIKNSLLSYMQTFTISYFCFEIGLPLTLSAHGHRNQKPCWVREKS